MYADDSNVIVQADNTEGLFKHGNSAAETMSGWCLSNGLKLNTTKSCIVQFATKNRTIDYSILVRTEEKSIANACNTKFLGIYLDQKLTWSAHVEYILPKLSSYCYLIRNIRDTVCNDILKLLYFGLAQATLSYGIIYWGQSSEAKSVFIAQKKILETWQGSDL